MMKINNAAITACGKGLPRHILHNHELEGFLDTTHEWIVSRTGISERRVAGSDEDNLSLSLTACNAALGNAGYTASDIDLVVVATTTIDRMVPSLACSLQGALGATGPALDVNAGCSGFLYALTVANAFMRDGLGSRALVVGTETLTRIVDWRERSTCVLFGDGAGAAVLEPRGSDEGFISICLGAQGASDYCIKADGGGSRMMASLGGGLDGQAGSLYGSLPFLGGGWKDIYPFVTMEGSEVFRFAVSKICDTVLRLCADAGIERDRISLIVPHQANSRIVEAAARRLGLPLERFFLNIDRYANTSAASIPIALEEAMAEGAVKGGDLVALVGFGAGLTWGGALLRWPCLAAGGERGNITTDDRVSSEERGAGQ
jgi:3-oxoacyl-[acyl-carrier-protein] synthase-3